MGRAGLRKRGKPHPLCFERKGNGEGEDPWVPVLRSLVSDILRWVCKLHESVEFVLSGLKAGNKSNWFYRHVKLITPAEQHQRTICLANALSGVVIKHTGRANCRKLHNGRSRVLMWSNGDLIAGEAAATRSSVGIPSGKGARKTPTGNRALLDKGH